jgi:transcriptional regulator with XRE-family HTH domain
MIRALREEKDLSQEGLARLAGLSVRTIAKIEMGEMKDPAWSTIIRLHRALDVPYAQFEKPFEKLLGTPRRRRKKPEKK